MRKNDIEVSTGEGKRKMIQDKTIAVDFEAFSLLA
jgi:hypothetical protein